MGVYLIEFTVTFMHTKHTKSIIRQANTMTIYPLLDGMYELEIYDSIDEAANRWSTVAPDMDLFLQVPYFKFLESRPPKGLSFKYLVFSKKNIPIGIAPCQLVQMRVGEALTDEKIPSYQQKINSWILKLANMNAIIVGNLLLTGDHSCHFAKGSIEPDQAYVLLKEALELLKNYLKEKGCSTSLLIFKDIEKAKKTKFQSALGSAYNQFELQPNMMLELSPEWLTFDNYLAALHSKARTRLKRAKKSGKDLIKKEFTVELIKAFLPQIDHLYKCIASKAGFNVLHLDGDYFLAFKEHFPKEFRVFGYFIEEELIAFYTTFNNKEELEAHYLGFDTENNYKYQAYLNILLDIIQIGIESKAKEINFARTALEIKSSVGAQPEQLYYFGKHTNPIKNRVFSPILDYFQPKEEWIPRNPFKKESS